MYGMDATTLQIAPNAVGTGGVREAETERKKRMKRECGKTHERGETWVYYKNK